MLKIFYNFLIILFYVPYIFLIFFRRFVKKEHQTKYKEKILHEFSFRDHIIKDQSQVMIDNIKNSNSVSIHLRKEKFLKDAIPEEQEGGEREREREA